MNRETSLYLDFIRFSAALVVMIGHLSGKRFTGGLLWQFSAFMDDAVIVFFVLSGFVIGYVVNNKEAGVEKYIIARAARIYSVALPALIVTFILDLIGRQFAPELYTISWGYNPENPLLQFFSGVFFVNQLWYSPVAIGSMLPYWSLGFEVWYYLFFAILYFSPARRKLLYFAAACAIAGPRIVAFFPIWMLGYGAYVFTARYRVGRLPGLLLLASSVLAYVLYCVFLKSWLSGHPAFPEPTGLSNIVPRYVVGLLFAIHIIGFVFASGKFFTHLKPCQAWIRWLAGATFTIYLFHIPVAQFLTTLLPWEPGDWRARAAILIGTFVSMFIIAEFTERKKETWHRWISNGYACARTYLRPSSAKL